MSGRTTRRRVLAVLSDEAMEEPGMLSFIRGDLMRRLEEAARAEGYVKPYGKERWEWTVSLTRRFRR